MLEESEPTVLTISSSSAIWQLRGDEVLLARVGPAAVGLDGVDLAVVGEEAERLGQRPARRGVGREALVEDTDRCLEARVAQVLVEARKIFRHHQALEGDDLAGERADVEVLFTLQRLLGMTTRHEQIDIEGDVGALVGGADEDLTDARQAVAGHRAAHAVIYRHVAPAQHLEIARDQRRLEGVTRGLFTRVIVGQEKRTDGIAGAKFQPEGFSSDLAHEAVRHLEQQATAIAGLAVSGNPATVGHAGQGFNGGLQQFVARLPFHMGDQTEAAVVAELSRMVETFVHGACLTEKSCVQMLFSSIFPVIVIGYLYFYTCR